MHHDTDTTLHAIPHSPLPHLTKASCWLCVGSCLVLCATQVGDGNGERPGERFGV